MSQSYLYGIEMRVQRSGISRYTTSQSYLYGIEISRHSTTLTALTNVSIVPLWN